MHENSERLLAGGIAWEADYVGFRRGDPIDNERMNPGLGVTIPYQRRDQGKATVYVYDKGRRDIPDNPMSEVVKDEFDLAARDVLSLGQAKGTTVELVKRYGTGSPERGVEFLCAEFVLTDSSGTRRTFLYLTGCRRKFVKLRVTLGTNDATDPTAYNFAEAVASRLWPSGVNPAAPHKVPGLQRLWNKIAG
jgi:hypothetical protein